MKPILERLKNGEVFVSDGAIGTLLLERGLNEGEPPEAFNISHPEIIEEIAHLYLEAGADIIQTNTFGASPLKLSHYSLQERTEEINRKAVQCVRNAVKDSVYISASCGPTNRLLKPYGDIDPEDIYEAFERQIRAQIEAGVDIVCIETMTDLKETILAVKAAKTVSTKIPVIATMTFENTQRGFYTIMGTNIEKAVEGLELAGADIIGSNCGNGIEIMIKIAKFFKKYTNLPVIIQSNAGIPEVHYGKITYPDTPDFMAEKAKELIASGVSIIGGCCGTTPEHIKAIRKLVDSLMFSI
ncbi:homocysteine S-methyltransferase family protein [candidate division WOR-3 bacterium]|nr:homocysteine S-methyltransferase family protein [candidate division WOR-3 bacterium]